MTAAQALQELIAKWRKTAKCTPPYSGAGERKAYIQCADDLQELAASLALPEPEKAWRPDDERLHERLVVLLDDELAHLVRDKESGRPDWIADTEANIAALKRAMELWPNHPAALPAPPPEKALTALRMIAAQFCEKRSLTGVPHGDQDAFCESCAAFTALAASSDPSPAQPEKSRRAHVIGCRKALSVPVDLCECGGRDFPSPAQEKP